MASSSPQLILIVEDEWLIAESLQELLEAAGFQVCGPAPRVSEALRIIEERKPDAAVLDVSLRGENSFQIAQALAQRSIPFAFMTGYVGSDIAKDFRDRPILSKPVDQAKLLACVEGLLTSS